MIIEIVECPHCDGTGYESVSHLDGTKRQCSRCYGFRFAPPDGYRALIPGEWINPSRDLWSRDGQTWNVTTERGKWIPLTWPSLFVRPVDPEIAALIGKQVFFQHAFVGTIATAHDDYKGKVLFTLNNGVVLGDIRGAFGWSVEGS